MWSAGVAAAVGRAARAAAGVGAGARRGGAPRAPFSGRSSRLWEGGEYGWATPVNALIAVNVAVFGVWHVYGPENASLRRAFNRYMMLSNSRVERSVAPWVGHMFMHADFFHLLGNMLALKSFGDAVAPVLGSRNFLALYGAAGLVGAAAQLAYHRHIPRSWPAARTVRYDSVSVGASAAIAGITFYAFALDPRGTIILYVLPVPTALFAAAFVGLSGWAAYRGSDFGAHWAHAAHLGGAATGLAWFAARRLLRR
jgi:membrane associated rhomboid family serine protease